MQSFQHTNRPQPALTSKSAINLIFKYLTLWKTMFYAVEALNYWANNRSNPVNISLRG